MSRNFSLSYVALATVFLKVVAGAGLFVEQKNSAIGVPVCEAGTSYHLQMASVQAAMPNFDPPPISCGERKISPYVPEACIWNTQDFLAMTFERGTQLMRRGVPKEDAFQIFEHSRGVLWNYEVCNPSFNNATHAHIPVALEALYGILVAQFQAKHSSSLSVASSALRPVAMKAFVKLQRVSQTFPLNLKFPKQILPSETLLVAANSSSMGSNGSARFVGRGSWTSRHVLRTDPDETLNSEIRMTQQLCDAQAPPNTWLLRQYPFMDQFVDQNQNCCASACVWLLESIAITPTGGLLDPCCERCNKYNCNPFDAIVKAAIELQTRIEVPALLNGYASIVRINV